VILIYFQVHHVTSVEVKTKCKTAVSTSTNIIEIRTMYLRNTSVGRYRLQILPYFLTS